MANRTRPIIMRLAVTEYEKELIEGKMQQLGTKNFGAYARKMLIDGYIIKVDYQMPGLQIITPQSAEVFRDDKVDLPALNGSQHSL